ncbi:MAG TPA: biosynthetic peptidoglycan transglycosylase, partial [Burkholderiaceae bacterium]|nr:biosynthetic peptidoglycan transglycosylase [Burkholderiaceae bacterium]
MSLRNRTLLHRLLFMLAFATLAALVFTAALLLFALQALQPEPDEWRTSVRLGPWQRDVSMPGLIRWAAHPLAAPLFEGRTLHTRWGDWRLLRSGAQLHAVCAPCRPQFAALGPAPLQLSRLGLLAHHQGAGRFAGTLSLAEGAQRVEISFDAQLQRRGVDLRLSMPATPMATLVGLFGHDLPEAATVQVTGTLALVVTARWPGGTWQARPAIDDFGVSGLGTEKLLSAQLPPACRTGAGDAAPLTGWLPRALLAAEDARFYEHPGYEIDQLLAAGAHNQRDGSVLRGASTLTQRLAKLTITGDDRSAARKLRELLYAVEMERTLGKARILQMYLALAPWG